ncbi:tetratricopeptide repeat protein 39C isoform X1 [Leptinotarsa decemlineata]|uniref:tetratricopeptide repeat protein 39C isoform X1 n=1 Tax=Leptinotarsa decemlineata TaxID=7539 RepID=UPI003D30BB26
MASNSEQPDGNVPEATTEYENQVPEWILAREGIKLIINNKSEEAEKIFLQHPENIVMFSGHSFGLMMDALMSFEEAKLSKAISALKEVEKRCATESGWLKQVSQRVFGYSDTTAAKSLADHLETQIILADSQVCLAILTFLQQDISGYLRGGWVLRKAWKVYQKVYKEILNLYRENIGELHLPDSTVTLLTSVEEQSETENSTSPDWEVPDSSSNGYIKKPIPVSKSAILYSPSNLHNGSSKNLTDSSKKSTRFGLNFLKKSMSVNSALSSRTTEKSWGNQFTNLPISLSSYSFSYSFSSQNYIENQKIEKEMIIRLMGAVSFGYGLFQLGISLLPPSLVRLINILGFSADRQNGIACLMYARLGTDMRAPLASLSLLWYHTIVRPFYGIDGTNVTAGVDASAYLLKESESEFDRSPLFLFFRGRVCRLNSDMEGALMAYQKAVDNSNQRELKVLCMHEIGWCHLIRLNYKAATDTFLYLKSSSRWSRAFYCYVAGICAGASENFFRSSIFEDFKAFGVGILKGTPLDQFLTKRYKFCPSDLELAEKKKVIFWKLLIFEMLYLWNALPNCDSLTIDVIKKDCISLRDPNDEPMKGLSKLIIGYTCCIQRFYGEAMEMFRDCLELRKNISPISDDAHISAFCQFELGSLLLMNEETKEEGILLLQKMTQYTKYDFDHKLNVRIYSLLRQYHA